MDEKHAIDAVLAGDREAFAFLVRDNEVRVRSLCLSLLRDRSEAEDAAQEVFLKAFRSLGSFHREAAFSTWLYRIARNQCLDRMRGARRRRTEPLDAIEGDVFEDKSAPAPEERLEVERVLAAVSPEERLVLTLREVQGLSYAEMAQALDVSLDGVKGRLKRARRSLQEAGRHFFEPRASKGMESRR